MLYMLFNFKFIIKIIPSNFTSLKQRIIFFNIKSKCRYIFNSD